MLKSKSNLLKSSKIPQYKESRKPRIFCHRMNYVWTRNEPNLLRLPRIESEHELIDRVGETRSVSFRFSLLDEYYDCQSGGEREWGGGESRREWDKRPWNNEAWQGRKKRFLFDGTMARSCQFFVFFFPPPQHGSSRGS